MPSKRPRLQGMRSQRIGPIVQGPPNESINGRLASRVRNPGIHAAFCGPNTWKAAKNSAAVFISRKAAHRQGDKAAHCGDFGTLTTDSASALVGDARPGAMERATIEATPCVDLCSVS